MAKIPKVQWIGLVPFMLLIILLIILWFITRFNQAIFYVLSIVIFFSLYISTHLFFYKLFEIGEETIKRDDNEILILEKEESSLWWMYISGAGFTFLVGGIPIFNTNPLFAITGLIFLTIGNLVYNIFYYPRYRLLYRRRIAELDSNKYSKSRSKI